MAKSNRKSQLVTESDVVVPDVTVDEAIVELSRVDILDWKKFHALSVVSNVQENDDVEAPREVEIDPKDLILEHLKAYQSESFSVLAKLTGIAQPGIFEYIKEIHSDGYCIVVEPQDDDAMIFFGLMAEAKLYEKINDKTVVTVQKVGRKQEVLAILQTGKHVTIGQIAKQLGISDRNVSSQLSYLRADNYKIATDSRGYKFLEE